MFVCIECGQKTKEKDRVFTHQNWCRVCVDKESLRSVHEDSIKGRPAWVRTRPPKYMLTKDRYKEFGYEQ